MRHHLGRPASRAPVMLAAQAHPRVPPPALNTAHVGNRRGTTETRFCDSGAGSRKAPSRGAFPHAGSEGSWRPCSGDQVAPQCHGSCWGLLSTASTDLPGAWASHLGSGARASFQGAAALADSGTVASWRPRARTVQTSCSWAPDPRRLWGITNTYGSKLLILG